jgi:protein O-mannosyl-transferase
VNAVRKMCRKPSGHLLLIILLGCIAYANTFHVPFVFDDQTSITENRVITQLDNFLFNSSGYHFNSRRFIGYLTFALNYRLGGLDVTGYHAVNLAIHVINALLVYGLVRITLRTPYFEVQRSTFNVQRSEPATLNAQPSSFILHPSSFIPLFAALLFVTHPLQSQAVTYIVQRLASLATLFYLLALVLYVRTRLTGESAGGVTGKGGLLYILSLISIVLAMKTKEIAFTLPLAVLLYELFFFRPKGWGRWLLLAPILLTLLIIPLGMLDIQKPVGEVISDVSEVTQHKAPVTRWEYLYTQFRVIVTYLRLLVFPVNQNLDYDYPLYHSLSAPPVLASFLFLAALFGLAVYLTYRSRFKVQGSGFEIHNSKFIIHNSQFYRLIAFGIFWFFLTLSVESSIIPITDVIYEHRVYLPSVGAFIAFATAWALLLGKLRTDPARKIGLATAAAAVILLAAATVRRNMAWQDTITLWEDVVGKSPGKVRGYNNLGAALADAERKDEAIGVLLKAIAVKPDHADAYYNLGRTYLFFPERLNDAIAMLTRAIELDTGNMNAYVNMAAAYIRAERYREAIGMLEPLMPKLGTRPDARFNLGVAYACIGNIDAAARELALLRGLDPQLAGSLDEYMARREGAKR